MPSTYLTRIERWRHKKLRKEEGYKHQAPYYAKIVRGFAAALRSDKWSRKWCPNHRHGDQSQISIDVKTHELLQLLHADTGVSIQCLFETACVHYRESLKDAE